MSYALRERGPKNPHRTILVTPGGVVVRNCTFEASGRPLVPIDASDYAHVRIDYAHLADDGDSIQNATVCSVACGSEIVFQDQEVILSLWAPGGCGQATLWVEFQSGETHTLIVACRALRVRGENTLRPAAPNLRGIP